MKYRLVLVLSLCSSLCGLVAVEKTDLDDPSVKRSYGLGANYGKLLERQSIEIDINSFLDGLRDGLAKESLLSDAEIQGVLKSITDELRARSTRKREGIAAKNKKDGEAFLAANRNKESVVTLKSGLQYKVIREGDGAIPSSTDLVKVHYRGTLIDGTVFDSSYDRGTPASFSVMGVIKGWTEALQLMKVGSKWQLFVPSELAYGERGAGTSIGPNSTLIYDVELLEITTTTPPIPKTAAKPKPITSDVIMVPSAEEMKKGAKVEVIKSNEVAEYINIKQQAQKKAKDKDSPFEEEAAPEEE
ncbi:MAG: Outer membrane protein MIP [Verrucomicrobia subdivision 3 bacterium]|nr:Outer membrane protein MIP [Limisphaerales bacterium]MCS1415707.1 Outer membrane protein MIP [Limisphaerales bacterium]